LRATEQITIEMIGDPLAAVPAELAHLYFELAKVISGTPDILTRATRDNFTRGVKLMAQMLSIRDGYRAIAYFGNKYTGTLRIRCNRTTRSSAVVTVQPTVQYAKTVTPYAKGCISNNCEFSRGTMSAIPRAIYGLEGVETIDTACCVHEIPDESRALHIPVAQTEEERELGHCQYRFSWRPRLTGYQRLADPLVLGGVASLAAVPVLWASGMPLPAKLLATGQAASVATVLGSIRRALGLKRQEQEVAEYLREQEARFERERQEITLAEIALRHRASFTNVERNRSGKMPHPP
jgi:hypothetical protein